mmetsp:Transcript_2683/g.7077  ORF Transcript_2683/g.7077 Transcript_2683/m.7077 type:complete len:83 (+) Transcript_2683:3-251(+)
MLYYEADGGKQPQRPWGVVRSEDGTSWQDATPRLHLPFGASSDLEKLRGRVRSSSVIEVDRATVARLHEVSVMMKRVREEKG